LDSIYGVTFEGKTYDIGNRFEWLKTSIEFALDDDEFKDDLVTYMKQMINEA
jgi:UTP--glucose-1-phosphate uridylyltransferase